MLTKKRQRRYLAEKGQRWLRELTVFDDSRDEEALHRLRVEIKKVRALVELTSANSGKPAARHFRGLKKVFKQAGAIRDASSHVRYLEQRNVLSPEQRDQQVRSIRAAAEVFAKHTGQYKKKAKKASRQLRMDIKSIHAGRIRRWYAREIVVTSMLLEGSGDVLHAARKKIKTLLYVYKLLPGAIADRIRLNTEYLDRLQQAIGEWHDAMVAIGEVPEKNEAMLREFRVKEEAVRKLAADFPFVVHIV
jgi:CHAD domain-containing protein